MIFLSRLFNRVIVLYLLLVLIETFDDVYAEIQKHLKGSQTFRHPYRNILEGAHYVNLAAVRAAVKEP